MDKKSITVETYIAQFPAQTQNILHEIRRVIREAAPDAREKISYGIPTFYQNGNLVHYAAYAGHIGFYPTPSGIEVFKDELTKYKSSKGAVQFPIDKPVPLDLIRLDRIVSAQRKYKKER